MHAATHAVTLHSPMQYFDIDSSDMQTLKKPFAFTNFFFRIHDEKFFQREIFFVAISLNKTIFYWEY